MLKLEEQALFFPQCDDDDQLYYHGDEASVN
jgi:hypothetical protein